MSEKITRQRIHIPYNTVDLEAAIVNLDKFSKENESESVPHVSTLNVEDGTLVTIPGSPLQRNIEVIKQFISAIFFKESHHNNLQRRDKVQKEVLRSIDTVKSHYLTIEKLKEGNLQQRILATSAVEVIQRYNSIIGHAKTAPNWRSRIAKFLYDRAGLSVDKELHKYPIDLPQPIAMQCNFTKDDGSSEIVKKISAKFLPQILTGKSCPPTVDIRALDAFRIKASSLLQKNGMIDTTAEALSCVRETPIHTSFDNNTSTLFQTLIPWPGVNVHVKGSFTKDPKTQTSVAIPHSFHLSFHSVQKGFPHALQHTGWSLEDSLIPACPHRLDQLELFRSILKSKKEIASALLPGGSLIGKARKILKIKRDVFKKNREEFLKLHLNLARAIIAAAPSNILPQNWDSITESYFDQLKKHSHPFEHLSETYQTIATHYIEQPYEKLQNDWSEHNNTDLCSKNSLLSYGACLKIFEEHAQNRSIELMAQKQQSHLELFLKTVDFCVFMGGVLGNASRYIILQHMSEIIKYPPPMLNSFEQKVQIAVYKQFLEFREELYLEPIDEAINNRFYEQLCTDIALFKSESTEYLEENYPAAHISNELESYFNLRYLSGR